MSGLIRTDNTTIRPANLNDSRFIFNLAMDPEVRTLSTRSESFTFAEHDIWYRAKLDGSQSRIWIGETDGIPFGQVRYGRDGTIAEIAISVSPTFRGKGLGKELLLTTEPWAREWLGVSRLVALVLTTNVVSAALFEAAGYEMTGWVERFHKQHRRYVK